VLGEHGGSRWRYLDISFASRVLLGELLRIATPAAAPPTTALTSPNRSPPFCNRPRHQRACAGHLTSAPARLRDALPRPQPLHPAPHHSAKNDPGGVVAPWACLGLRGTRSCPSQSGQKTSTVACLDNPLRSTLHRMGWLVGNPQPNVAGRAKHPWRRCAVESTLLRRAQSDFLHASADASKHGTTTFCHASSFARENEIEPLAEAIHQERSMGARLYAQQPAGPLRCQRHLFPRLAVLEPSIRATFTALSEEVLSRPPHR